MPEETPEPQIAQKPTETAETVAEIQPAPERPTKPWLKIILFSILGIVLAAGLVFAGYKLGQRQIQPGPQPTPTSEVVITPAPEPTVAEVSQPSPSPVSIEKIPYKSISSWQTYTDSQANFSVQYPENYKLQNPIPGKSVNFLSCLTDPQRGEICLSGYSITIYDDYDGGPRRAYFEKKRPNFLVEPYYQDVSVAGIKTLVIMDGNTGGSTGSFILIPKGNKMYFFDFPFGWNPDTKEKPGLDFIKQVLSTFRFLE